MKNTFSRFLAVIAILSLMLSLKAAAAAGQGLDAPEIAFQAALDGYNAAHQTDFAIVLSGQMDGFAYASALSGAPEMGGGPLVMLAEAPGGQGWVVLIPGESAAEEYNRLLERFPDPLIDPETKALLRQPESRAAQAPALAANYSGHRLPWPNGQAAYVTQKDTSYHMNQIDFDIRGLAASGDVFASAPGTVVFVKDSSSTNCQIPAPDPCWKKSNMVVVQHDTGEYTWYVHLAYRSATVSVGQRVGYGTKLGVEGETGYAFGVHLHYMASSGHTTWTDPNHPNNAPWGIGIDTPVDFDEYSWSELVVTYSSTYTSQNGANLTPTCPNAGGVLLYRDSSYNCTGLIENFGYAFRGAAGFQNLTASFQDTASSVRVPSGWSVMLYEDPDRGGGKKCFNAVDSNFSGDVFDNGSSLNDRVSSMEVFSSPDCPTRAPADLTAPTGSLTSPASGAQVGRTVQFDANAGDAASGVQMVRFNAAWEGETRVVYTDASAPYSYNWDVCGAGIPDGSITVSATVIDREWNSYTTPAVSITKQYNCGSAPTGSWTASYWANPTLSGSPSVQAQVSSPFLFFDWGSGAADASLPVDGWSARFTRTFSFSGGAYRFRCKGMDGCRLYVDGQERVSGWQGADFAAFEWSGQVSAGSHEIRVESYDNGAASARLEAWWEGPGFLGAEQACDSGGWCVSYWGNADQAGAPAATRNEGEVLHHSWGAGGPDALLPNTGFSTRAERTAGFDCGTYRFRLDTADPVRMWVDETLLIDQWSEPSQPVSRTADAALERGEHALRIEHAGLGSTTQLQASWEKISACPAAATVTAVSTHIVRPGAAVEPAVNINVTAGELDPSRGDGLAYISGGALGAAQNQPVHSLVESGQGYRFDPSNGFRMTAPSTSGSYTSLWAARAGGEVISPAASIQVIVDGAPPQVSIVQPAGGLISTSALIQASISDAHSGATHAQFLAGYHDSGGWGWHSLGYDLDGGNGWSFTWNTSGISDQQGISLLVAAWDGAGNESTAVIEDITLDRTPPSTSVSALEDEQDSTRFLVSWDGSDQLSGIVQYDVQVKVDGGAAQNWLTGVSPETRSAWYTGEMGRSYVFQVRAVDAAGNPSAYSAGPSTTVNICTPDATEPDNLYSQATALTVGGELQRRNFCATGDVDWLAFDAAAGTEILLQANWSSAAGSAILTLYAADGKTVLAQHVSGGSALSLLHWTPASSEKLYFSVRLADTRVAGDAVTYSTRVAEARGGFIPYIRK